MAHPVSDTTIVQIPRRDLAEQTLEVMDDDVREKLDDLARQTMEVMEEANVAQREDVLEDGEIKQEAEPRDRPPVSKAVKVYQAAMTYDDKGHPHLGEGFRYALRGKHNERFTQEERPLKQKIYVHIVDEKTNRSVKMWKMSATEGVEPSDGNQHTFPDADLHCLERLKMNPRIIQKIRPPPPAAPLSTLSSDSEDDEDKDATFIKNDITTDEEEGETDDSDDREAAFFEQYFDAKAQKKYRNKKKTKKKHDNTDDEDDDRKTNIDSFNKLFTKIEVHTDDIIILNNATMTKLNDAIYNRTTIDLTSSIMANIITAQTSVDTLIANATELRKKLSACLQRALNKRKRPSNNTTAKERLLAKMKQHKRYKK